MSDNKIRKKKICEGHCNAGALQNKIPMHDKIFKKNIFKQTIPFDIFYECKSIVEMTLGLFLFKPTLYNFLCMIEWPLQQYDIPNYHKKERLFRYSYLIQLTDR